MRYSEEVKEFIKDNVIGTRTKDLADLVNDKFGTEFTQSKMKSFLQYHKLKTGLQTKVKGEGSKYPQEVRDFINNNHTGIGPSDMAGLVNKNFGTNYTEGQIKGYYGRHKLNSGLTGRFQKGQAPWNKGKKGYMGPNRTSFKKGQLPKNHRSVGSERINVYGYIEVKVEEPNKWGLKHRIIWEEHIGPIPEGYNVIFGDKNPLNLDIDNLILVSKKQLLGLNRDNLIQENAELTKIAVNVVDLKYKIAKRKE